MIFFRTKRLRDCFFGPTGGVICFFCLRGCVTCFLFRDVALLFFWPKRLRDFFLAQEVYDLFCLRGCVIFLARDVAYFFMARDVV